MLEVDVRGTGGKSQRFLALWSFHVALKSQLLGWYLTVVFLGLEKQVLMPDQLKNKHERAGPVHLGIITPTPGASPWYSCVQSLSLGSLLPLLGLGPLSWACQGSSLPHGDQGGPTPRPALRGI